MLTQTITGHVIDPDDIYPLWVTVQGFDFTVSVVPPESERRACGANSWGPVSLCCVLCGHLSGSSNLCSECDAPGDPVYFVQQYKRYDWVTRSPFGYDNIVSAAKAAARAREDGATIRIVIEWR